MKTILVDDELLSMQQFEEECKLIPEIDLVGKFADAKEAYEFAKNNQVEFALLDIEMPVMNGLELGRKLKKINQDMIIIYVTGYAGYVAETLKVKADYCIMKPYNKQDILDAVYRAKLLSKRFKKRLRAETFGRFCLFADEQPVYFPNSKAQELLALCIHREGGIVTMEQAISELWPDRPYDDKVKRLYRKATASIQEVLSEYGVFDLFVSKRGSCMIRKENLDCDLYSLLDGEEITEARLAGLGEGYMIDYSWAESRIVSLMENYPIVKKYYFCE